MKKLIMLLAVALLVFTGCKDEDDIFHIAKNPTEINSMDKTNLAPYIAVQTETIKIAGGTAITTYTKNEIYIVGEYNSESYRYTINKSSLDSYNLYYTYLEKNEEIVGEALSASQLGSKLLNLKFN